MELKLWETVAASLANPVYFRPFAFHGKTYLDGGLRSPNPSAIADRERRLIWPDAGEPDLFLSLGTGQNRIAVLDKLSSRSKDSIIDASGPDPTQSNEDARKASKKRFRRADEILEAEIAWQNFRSSAVTGKSEAKGRRFIRFNPDLDRDPPAQDSKSDLENLQLTVRKRLQTPHRLAALRNVAHRLIASSFYLESPSIAHRERSEQVINGTIHCRFEDGSSEISALGKILEERTTEGFEPYFLIKPDAESMDASSVLSITPEIMRSMSESGIFTLPNVQITLGEDIKSTTINLFLTGHDGLEPDGFPISGFPRALVEGSAASKPNPRRTVRDRTSSDQISLRTTLTSRHQKRASEADSVSLSGMPKTSEDAWLETQNKFSYVPKSGHLKMSLADLIAQHQSTAAAGGRQRTNRFWTYIGNHHMVQHPEMYTNEDIEKFAASTNISLSELSAITPTQSQTSLGTDSISLSANSSRQEYGTPSERQNSQSEANGHATPDMQQEDDPQSDEYHPERHSSLQERSDSQSRDAVPSQIDTVFEEEDDDGASAYSGREAYAKASPVVQVRQRNTIDSLVNMYKTKGTRN